MCGGEGGGIVIIIVRVFDANSVFLGGNLHTSVEGIPMLKVHIKLFSCSLKAMYLPRNCIRKVPMNVFQAMSK